MRPFEDIRVLDLTHVLAGPFATYQLAVLGADVIKIESPEHPDMMRCEGGNPSLNHQGLGTWFLGQNAGKRAMTLDLQSREGKAVLSRLIEGADVLVQNYAGDAINRLGFGPEACHQINPRLIHCSMTGFGQTGTKAGHPAYDVVIQAFSGLMAANGADAAERMRVGPPMVDYGTGAQAALAISAALYQRDKTGKGQTIDVAMTDCALMLMSGLVAETLTTGKSPSGHGNRHPDYAGYGAYPTAEGEITIGAFTTPQFARMFETLGDPIRAREIRAMERWEIAHHRAEDEARIEQRLARRSAEEWEALLNANHVPAARIRPAGEAIATAQIASRGVLQPCPDLEAAGGPARLPVAGFAFAHGGPEARGTPPRHGEHTDEILAEAGYRPDEIEKLRAAGAI
ncbi:MAG: CaiB/BaiF CoA-transferase family protein [Pseudomonadota bacterium]